MTTQAVPAAKQAKQGGLASQWRILLVLALPLAIYYAALQERVSLAIFWSVGIAVGFTLQRARLCFVSGFRDLYLLHQGRTLRGLIVGLGVATIGFAMIMGAITPNPATGAVPQDAHILPVGIATVAGGLMFGVGMVLAGGCVSGSLYRMGEGYVASWVSMGGVMVGLYAMNRTWNWWWDFTIATSPRVWLPTDLGYTTSIAITIALLALAYIGTMWWERKAPAFASIPIKRAQPAPPASVGDDVRLTLQRVFRKEWTPMAGAIVLSTLNILLFIRYKPLGVVGEISRWSTEAASGVGLPLSVQKGLDTLAGCAPGLGGDSWFTDGFMLNTGLVLGSFTAAVIAREFRLRIPRQPQRYVQSALGGVVMGYGAALGLGCTLGAFYSAIPSLALNGWVYAVAMATGAFIGALIIRRLA